MLDEIVASIGPKVRRLRLQKGLSLQQLAERSGVSAAAIHKVERNGMVPTITTLIKLAAPSNRPVSYFVDEDSDIDAVAALVRSGERKPVYTSKKGLRWRTSADRTAGSSSLVQRPTMEPHADSGPKPMEHPGEELVHVLRGNMEFEVDGETSSCPSATRCTSGPTAHIVGPIRRPDQPLRCGWRCDRLTLPPTRPTDRRVARTYTRKHDKNGAADDLHRDPFRWPGWRRRCRRQRAST